MIRQYYIKGDCVLVPLWWFPLSIRNQLSNLNLSVYDVTFDMLSITHRNNLEIYKKYGFSIIFKYDNKGKILVYN